MKEGPLSKLWQLGTIFHSYYANQCIVGQTIPSMALVPSLNVQRPLNQTKSVALLYALYRMSVKSVNDVQCIVYYSTKPL